MQKIVSLPALKSRHDLLSPCSLFNISTKLGEKNSEVCQTLKTQAASYCRFFWPHLFALLRGVAS